MRCLIGSQWYISDTTRNRTHDRFHPIHDTYISDTTRKSNSQPVPSHPWYISDTTRNRTHNLFHPIHDIYPTQPGIELTTGSIPSMIPIYPTQPGIELTTGSIPSMIYIRHNQESNLTICSIPSMIYIRHNQESNSQPVPSQIPIVHINPTRPQWRFQR